ncbi:DUF1906 domain-containing protein [Pseudomonas syringae]|uniref:DUF1906 domain-containing protein n=1 Tax=Pseudomonas syringae TaxID=317 RepID=A0A9Q4A9H9_PSESX|nr:DUF1906 domain-containing protein [Pseudomonas syringae]MCF5467843.1 DUF1906 domain-containing protein [Pseudomonas syringae]MCF5472368.1 DUF1906 domain-containing protein [Pseudomonas syringae]MCF5481654.1 DUF1906 domain-containing protein [Pseudomonas syringae]MCF5488103.1 DUF1906 domain-containing protein [Pseudomonas syringae]MCF5494024.1 DUF1906 domain-containing protein [Pseudomonas syringae]
MQKGFDVRFDTTRNIPAIVALERYAFIGRYLCENPLKRIHPAEAQALRQANLAIALIYEDSPKTSAYFTSARGAQDAARAIQQAQNLGAGAGTAIYFTVDYDASANDVAEPIGLYFHAVASAVRNDVNGFVMGVYGSGMACTALHANKLVDYTWLAQSTKWRGYDLKKQWSIIQGSSGEVCSLSVDTDTLNSETFGPVQFRESTA